MDLTIGKARGLQLISDDRVIYTRTALDHRGPLKRALSNSTERTGRIPPRAAHAAADGWFEVY